ncbi:MAG TPA: hypothetical protein VED18_04265 [Candidatus Sulfotelmatobacter sp.]|nr:hypothetical protein [Candidatus Sulfotelmatobacter sp.]
MKKRIILSVAALATAFALGAGTVALTAEPHPQIHAAIRALRSAAGHLERAAHDYGGHRTKALELVRGAEAELQQALAYAGAPR